MSLARTDRTCLESPELFETYINLWISQVEAGNVVASEPSLVLALGLADRAELKELEESRADLVDSIKRARTFLEAYWFQQLQRPSREINVAGPIFALKAQAGYRDTDGGKSNIPVQIHIHSQHAAKL